ncbi:MAG TPA: proton-conducting transporter membrane subunit [Chloroflexota bacterium]|nr:proton-conducting transporter membrane subunit [Chloroflexota bacterium]
MTPLGLFLLIGVPLGAGAAAAVLPRGHAFGVAVASMVSVFLAALVTQTAAPLAIGETQLALTQIGRLQLGFIALIGLALLAYQYLAGRVSALAALLPPLTASIAAGSLFGRDLLVAASFLQLAALSASLLMSGEQPKWGASLAGAIYVMLSALGGMALLFGFVLADIQRLSPGGLVTLPFVVAALTVGLALQLGAAPLHFWLPNAFQRAGPAAVTLAVGLIGPASLGLLLQALSAQPQLVGDARVNRLISYGGLLTAGFGALAALAPSKPRRVLGYLMVADLGYVLAGMATYTRIGVTGAVLHMAHRSLLALLLVAAVSELERENRGSEDETPAPYMWGTLIVGVVSLTGLPPLAGFAANWAVLQAISLTDTPLALALAATSAVSLVAALSSMGRLHREYAWPWRRPRPTEIYLMGLALFTALWGLAPGPALGAIHSAVSQLPFLKPF